MSIGSDGNTTIRKFALNLTKKINSSVSSSFSSSFLHCENESKYEKNSKEELEIMFKLRQIRNKILKNEIKFNKIEKQAYLPHGDLLWEFCGQNYFYLFLKHTFKKKDKVTYNYCSAAGDLCTYYF